jgi:hypothetical protein
LRLLLVAAAVVVASGAIGAAVELVAVVGLDLGFIQVRKWAAVLLLLLVLVVLVVLVVMAILPVVLVLLVVHRKLTLVEQD